MLLGDRLLLIAANVQRQSLRAAKVTEATGNADLAEFYGCRFSVVAGHILEVPQLLTWLPPCLMVAIVFSLCVTAAFGDRTCPVPLA